VCEEVFGPVVVVLRYRTLEEAIRRANASSFGLMAAVFTSSLAPAMQAATMLQAGGVIVNRSTNFRLDHLPYGGVKEKRARPRGSRLRGRGDDDRQTRAHRPWARVIDRRFIVLVLLAPFLTSRETRADRSRNVLATLVRLF